MANSTMREVYWKNSENELFARVVNTNTTTNLNANTTYTNVPLAQSIVKMDSVYSLVTNGIQVSESDWYSLKLFLGISSTISGMIVQATFAINGSARPFFGTTNDIQTGYGNNTTSCDLDDYVYLNAGDIVTVVSRRVGNAGTATMINGSCYLQLQKSAKVGLLYREAKSKLWVWAEEDAGIATGANDWSFGAGQEGNVNHGMCIPSNGRITKMAFRSSGTGSLNACSIGIYINGVLASGGTISVPTGSNNAILNIATPIVINAGNWINFRTITATSTVRQDCVVGIEIELD